MSKSKTEGTFTSIADMNLEDVRPAGLIPKGPWVLRCTGSKYEEDGGTDRETDETYDTALLVHEPFRAQEGVDSEDVNATDPVTGKLLYDGRRIYTRFFLRDMTAVDQLRQVLAFHGIAGMTVRQGVEKVKGRKVIGLVITKKARTQDGVTYPPDNAVKSWSAA